MRDLNDSDALDSLLCTCVFPGQDARRLPAALAHACEVLREAGASFVLVGRAALARYCPAQFTNRLILRVAEDGRTQGEIRILRTTLAAPPSCAPEVDLRVETAVSDSERRIITSAPSVTWLRARVPVATPEHLLCLACISWRASDVWDAENVVRSGHVDWKRFSDLVENDPKIRGRAQQARREAARLHLSFSEAWQRRLRARAQDAESCSREVAEAM